MQRELDDLVTAGLLYQKIEANEWLEPGNEAVPVPPLGYVVWFIPFPKRGLGAPTHDFFRALLHQHGVELQHLNPNRIQQICTFIMLYEGFLGIEPHFVHQSGVAHTVVLH